ncbi:MAG: DEAD/DEAH box helicase [Methanobrevibacter sp.]|nr:DEAD/DEAH box helicase [Methanobrevibacter sp.]
MDIEYGSFSPSFLFNDSKKGVKVLSPIKENLSKCDEFYISVAFITEGGITPLLQVLSDLEKRNIPGKILTTDYLAFSEPKALEKLNQLDNIELRMYNVSKDNPGLHTKGYLFREDGDYRIIIGSSNLTQNALTVNKEWNLGFSSLESDDLSKEILDEFNNLWDRSTSFDDCIGNYRDLYEKRRIILNERPLPSYEPRILEPNSMQESFINNLEDIYATGGKRALLISATGTGKTYAAAFALKEKYPKRALFLVHREQIAKQALNTFKKVFDNTRTMGLLSGNSKECGEDYIFATIQTMSKEHVFKEFNPDEFDYIIIDEVHRAGAKSYQKIMDYFTPKFYLGMSASPDRMDGFDIYKLFDHNIAYEIRLNQALDEDLLCPFHYFGITDVKINDEDANFDNIVSSDRVNYIVDRCRFFGYSGRRVKGLMFCSTKKEACELSEMLNEKGLKTTCLTGENTQEERIKAIERLTTDTDPDYLDYILTVDIFNEGVDIPEINQIVLLRETQSPIIFIQQLGRGLRKFDSKEYLVVIDFIGNYNNNYMIPIALSGDRTYNKDNLIKYVMEGTNVIPGVSTIDFDRISRERIFRQIENTNLSKIAILKEKYDNLKYKLGKIPTLVEFYNLGDIDPILILENSNKKYNDYYNFLKNYDDDFTLNFNLFKRNTISFISNILANGKRPHEIIILKQLIKNSEFSISSVEDELLRKYGIIDDLESIKNAIANLNLEYFTSKTVEKYSEVKFFNLNNEISKEFSEAIEDSDFKEFLDDLLNYSLLKYENEYINRYNNVNLVLNKEYSKSDALRLLNWSKDIIPLNIGGYRFNKNICAIFVNYEKNDDEIQYGDKFINQELFSWMSRKNRTLESKELQPIINYENNDLKIHLFIRKHNNLNFYYLGEVKPIDFKNDKMPDGEVNIVNFKLKLDIPVRYDIYNYINSYNSEEYKK